MQKKMDFGQGLIEYGLIVLLLGLSSILALNLMGVSTSELLQKIFPQTEETAPAVVCDSLAQPGKNWLNFKDKYFKGGVEEEDDGYHLCKKCGAILPEYSGSDYLISLPKVKVTNSNTNFNGYGVAFRADYDKSGLNGYTVQIEKQNKTAVPQIYFTKWAKGNQILPPLAALDLPAGVDWKNPPALTVKVEGEQFTAYLDGKAVLTASDPTYLDGKVGVVTNKNSEMVFDNLDVSSVTCPVE